MELSARGSGVAGELGEVGEVAEVEGRLEVWLLRWTRRSSEVEKRRPQ